MSPRAVVAVVVLLVFAVVSAGVVYLRGQRGCPPPTSALWPIGEDGSFACIAGL